MLFKMVKTATVDNKHFATHELLYIFTCMSDTTQSLQSCYHQNLNPK